MTSALICVGSPLQAICAIEAIAVYSINQYKILVIDDGTRLPQIRKLFDEKGFRYTIIPFHVPSWKNIMRMIECVNPFKGKYDYLLMGDYRLTGNRMECVPLIKNHGKIVYLDDGSYIVSWSKGLIEEKGITKLRNRLMEMACEIRGISYKNIFTMFSKDIQMPGYNIQENLLTQLQISSDSIGHEVLFIGTNPLGEGGYCTFMGIDFSHYLEVLKRMLSDIREKNKDARIIYIPHGRDISEETRDICNELGIEYKKMPVCIELYVLTLKTSPKEIWSFGSTALYTLRRLCPGSELVNITIEGTIENSVEQYKELADIYEKNGINNVWVK